MTDVDRSLPAGTAAVPIARRALDELGAALPPRARDDARLLVSELVTNSVRHARLEPDQEIRFRASVRDGVLRVEVTDPGRGFTLRPRTEDSQPDSGWGLFLVGEVADRWGVSSDGGTSVWFELDVGGPRRGPASTRTAGLAERPAVSTPDRRGTDVPGSTREPREVGPDGDAPRRGADRAARDRQLRIVRSPSQPARHAGAGLRRGGLRHQALGLQPCHAVLAA
jgi:anti-sigma regulatory factor (Ser/Thr protein kinase)